MKKINVLWLLCWLAVFPCHAVKGLKDLVTVCIVPNHYDWYYKQGEPAEFTVSLIRDQQLLDDVWIHYEIGPEKMPFPVRDSVLLKGGKAVLKGKGLEEPGFLSCCVTATVDGFRYRNLINVGYEPENIKPTTILPDDFMEFWSASIAEMRKIPLTSQITRIGKYCTPDVEVYHVKLSHYRKENYLYGILCIPVGEGKYPAVLRLPGAGVAKHTGDVELAKKGVITFRIGIHGIPLDMDASVYKNLANGALYEYMFSRFEDRDKFYYHRVFLGCVRANDFLTRLPQYDGKNLAAYGGSQGGALAIVTAALDPRVRYLAAFYPAMCDLMGYKYHRAGGWMHILPGESPAGFSEAQEVTSRYYDVVNFARFIRIPGFYSWGYSDETCPPTSFYSAYNLIDAPKDLYLLKETGHWRYPEQNMKVNDWLMNKLCPGD